MTTDAQLLLMARPNKRSKQSLRAVDLFSGCGGLTVGLKRAGFAVAAAVEIERKAQETYRLNHPDVPLFGEDIRKIDPADVLRDAALGPGDLDLLAGCPPCQGFSRLRTKNKRTSVKDHRNDLVDDFLRFVEVMNPKTVMLENVPALARHDRFLTLRGRLHALGYKTVASILDAADFGVPQRRKRLIMLASKVHAPALADKSDKRITVREALGGLRAFNVARDKLHGLAGRGETRLRA